MNDTNQLRKDATLEDKVFDFLGKYTIILNGTTCEKDANQPMELTALHKREVVDRFLKLLPSTLGQADIIKKLCDLVAVVKTNEAGITQEIKQLAHTLAHRIPKPKECGHSITIRVNVANEDVLVEPIEIDDEKIYKIGIYLIKGIRYWIVVGNRKPKPQIEELEIPELAVCGYGDTDRAITHILTLGRKIQEIIRVVSSGGER